MKVSATLRAALIAAGTATVLLVGAVAITPLPAELRERAGASSILVEDRDGHLLREIRADDGARVRWTSLAELQAVTVRAVLAAEDGRFYEHPGVDALAIVRAAALDLWHRRFVSGGSTLTMQLARILRPHPRTLRGKIAEMLLALRIEFSLSKDQILEQYLNRASFGPNLRGIAAAGRAYLDKTPRSFSVAESALLAGLPRGPSLYEVTRHPERARRRRDRVLDRMAARGWIDPATEERAKSEPVAVQATRPAFGAPHFVQGVVSGDLGRLQSSLAPALAAARPAARIVTTIDADLQRAAEAQVVTTVDHLRGQNVSAASAIVVDNASGDVLAYVGSPDVFDAANGGANDGVRARRQAGSTLKPFLYGLAMEDLGFDPATRLPDVELHVSIEGGADYAPRDYDGRFRGPVRLRAALGGSLNVPAVWTVERVGVGRLLERLRDLGFASLTHDADYYGPGLALGDGEVTLLELARAYATLARGGIDRPLRVASRVEGPGGTDARTLDPEPGLRAMPKRFADLIADVLADHGARAGSFGEDSVLDFAFDVAAKTGTSKGYRDNWAIGFTRAVTVAVWVGNFDGRPMTNVSGITGAGPLFHALMDAAMRGRPRDPLTLASAGADSGTAARGSAESDGVERVEVCALSGDLAGPDCPHRIAEWRLAENVGGAPVCAMHERVDVDRRNGLRAGPGCAPAVVANMVFERFAPEFVSWADAVGRPVAPRDWSPDCPGPSSWPDREGGASAVDDARPRIEYPPPGARFAIDPDRPREAQRLDIRIIAPGRPREALLVVDGRQVARVAAPFEASWRLEVGEHDLVAEVDGAKSPAVRVRVRE
jgi:penicillin-binding protein 1C